MTISYKMTVENVDWEEMKATLIADDFDNGRSPMQLRISFENSFATCIAFSNDEIIGTVRALSDGVCNAYIVDVWTYTPFRHQGIASEMMRRILDQLQGQHVYLFTDDTVEFYESLGFQKKPVGMEIVIGDWLVNDSAD